MESPFGMDSNEIKDEDHLIAFQGEQQHRKQCSILQQFDCNHVFTDFHQQLNDFVEYKNFFRFSQSIYENRINNDVNYLDIMEDPDEIRSGFRYLQSRYNELHRYSTKVEAEADSSAEIINKLKKYGFRQMASAEKILLKNLFNILSESKYLRENFEEHQFVYIDNLVLLDEELVEVNDIEVLKKMYTFLKQRFTELQNHSLIQESKIEDCKNLMDELFAEIEGENEQEQTDRVIHSPEAKDRVVNTSRAKGRVYHSPGSQSPVVDSSTEPNSRVASSPVKQVMRRNIISSERRQGERYIQNAPAMDGEVISPECRSSFSESADNENDIEEEQKPQRAVMPEHVALKGLPSIRTHVYSSSRLASGSKVKVFNEKVKSYDSIGSTGYGKSKTRRSEFNKATILPPVQSRVVKYHPNAPETQQSMHSEYELAIKRTSIKGIVKPSLLNKDILRLRDPSVRVRGAPKQQDVHQELNKTPILPSIPLQRGLAQIATLQNKFTTPQSKAIILPKIPQPPTQTKQQRVSRIPRLLNIQQQTVQSRIPQPPKGERLRDAGKYIQRRTTRFQ